MSKITVTTIAGLTSGGDANTVKIESGDTLAVQSNATVGGTLGVTGASTLTGATTISGDLAVDTNVLKVDTSNNRVGINTTSPSDDLEITTSADEKGITLKTTSDIRPYLNFDANRGSANNTIARIQGKWNGTTVTRMELIAGSDTSNKDDGAIAFQTASQSSDLNQRMRITNNGPIGFGVIATSDIASSISFTATGNGTHADKIYKFGPHYTGGSPAFYVIDDSSVGVYLAYGGNSWQAHSDERIKENITPLENVLPDIKNIRCVKYNLKGKSETKIGFIAQDWETKFSEVVDEDNSRQVIESDGTISMDDESESTTKVKALSYTETIPVLLKAIQELEAKVKALESK